MKEDAARVSLAGSLESSTEVVTTRMVVDSIPGLVALLTTNGDLQFVPEPIARQKLARLGQASAGLAEVA